MAGPQPLRVSLLSAGYLGLSKTEHSGDVITDPLHSTLRTWLGQGVLAVSIHIPTMVEENSPGYVDNAMALLQQRAVNLDPPLFRGSVSINWMFTAGCLYICCTPRAFGLFIFFNGVLYLCVCQALITVKQHCMIPENNAWVSYLILEFEEVCSLWEKQKYIL